MYFKNIADKELNMLPKPYVPNFSIKLSDILHKTGGAFDNKLFHIEEIITDTIYRIYPLFNCKKITSTNKKDEIFDNRLIICTKLTTETFITFLSDDGDVQDYVGYGNYYSIGDNLTIQQYNGIVHLLRNNHSAVTDIRISDELTETEYGNYVFEWENGIILDNGIKLTSSTTLKCKLSNKQLGYSKYSLNLKALRIDNTNTGDEDITENKVIIPISVDLANDEYVDIPLSSLDVGDVILYGVVVSISHDLPVIPDIPRHIHLDSDKSIIQTGDKADLKATVYDISGVETVESGHDVYFYEAYEPTLLTLTSDKSIIQTGDKADLKATLKDEDGSLIQDEEIYFYIVEDE